uniref:Uncharacterized protein n=1 Tax=Bracon brevicornis TaxID=1563983 RepID=A0A6V7LHD4_9HYME
MLSGVAGVLYGADAYFSFRQYVGSR